MVVRGGLGGIGTGMVVWAGCLGWVSWGGVVTRLDFGVGFLGLGFGGWVVRDGAFALGSEFVFGFGGALCYCGWVGFCPAEAVGACRTTWGYEECTHHQHAVAWR